MWPSDRPQPLASTITWAAAATSRQRRDHPAVGRWRGLDLLERGHRHRRRCVGCVRLGRHGHVGRFVPMTPARLIDTRDTCGQHRLRRHDPPSRRRPGRCDRDGRQHHDDRVERARLLQRVPGRVGAARCVGAQHHGRRSDRRGRSHRADHPRAWPCTRRTATMSSSTCSATSPARRRCSADGLFVAATPTRLIDTRAGGVPVYTNGSIAVDYSAVTGGKVAAIVANFTATQSTRDGFLTIVLPTTTASRWCRTELRRRAERGQHGHRRLDRRRVAVCEPHHEHGGRSDRLVHRHSAARDGWRGRRQQPATCARVARMSGNRSCRWPTRRPSGSGCARTATPPPMRCR